MTQSRYPLRRTTLACTIIVVVILGIVIFRACSRDDSGRSIVLATEAQMARFDSIESSITELEKRTDRLKGKKNTVKDSTASSGKRAIKEKAPRKKPVERSFLDEDVNR